jgi:hypothetical protein
MDNFSFGPDGHSVADGPSGDGMDIEGQESGIARAVNEGIDSELPTVLPQTENGGAGYTGSYWFVGFHSICLTLR